MSILKWVLLSRLFIIIFNAAQYIPYEGSILIKMELDIDMESTCTRLTYMQADWHCYKFFVLPATLTPGIEL